MSQNILVVEDDEFISEIIARKLEKSGFSISLAHDGQEAIDQLAKSTPDIVLLDILLPKVNGLEVLKSIRSKPETKQLPVLVFSNLGSKEEIKTAMDLGATEYMVKASYTIDELIKKINQILNKK